MKLATCLLLIAGVTTAYAAQLNINTKMANSDNQVYCDIENLNNHWLSLEVTGQDGSQGATEVDHITYTTSVPGVGKVQTFNQVLPKTGSPTTSTGGGVLWCSILTNADGTQKYEVESISSTIKSYKGSCSISVHAPFTGFTSKNVILNNDGTCTDF